MTIPKVIHVIWCGPHAPPQELIDSTANKHVNGWLFTLWRDEKAGWQNQDQINAMKELNGKADLMRLEILRDHGGVAVDADALCLRPLDEGPEDFLANDVAFSFYENENVRPGLVGCGAMGAPKGSPFFKECVTRAASKDMSQPAWKTIGPGLITEVALAMPDQIRVYPAKWVHPRHYSGAMAPGASEIKPYYEQKWAGTVGYNQFRKVGCTCHICSVQMIRCPWG